MSPKIAIVIFIGIILFVGGIWFALLLPDNTYQDTRGPSDTTSVPLFSDLRLGTPVRAEFANQKNPPIKQKSEYTVNELIMLRGTTTEAATDSVSLDVRLVDDKSRIVPLTPSSVSLAPGTNSYCCWTIETPGKYTMQIFRPDSIISTLPITIVRDYTTLSQ